MTSLVPSFPTSQKNNNKDKYRLLTTASCICAINSTDGKNIEILSFKDGKDLNTSHISNAAEQLKSLGLTSSVSLFIPSNEVMLKKVILPLSAMKQDLEKISLNQLQTLTPFKKEEILFSYRTSTEERSGKNLVLKIYFLLKRNLSERLKYCEKIGINPKLLKTTIKEENRETELHFELTERSEKAINSDNKLRKALISAIVILLFANTYLLFQSLTEENKKLTDISILAKKELAERRKISLNTSLLVDKHNLAVQEKQASLTNYYILNELSKTLPNHSWVFSFRKNSTLIELQGFSKNTSEVIRKIENNDNFSDVKLKAGIERNTTTSLERFHLQFKVPLK